MPIRGNECNGAGEEAERREVKQPSPGNESEAENLEERPPEIR